VEYCLPGELPSVNNDVQKLQKIIGKTFRKAKRWYLMYLVCQLCVLVFALISIFVELSPNLAAVIAFVAVLATECLRWKSDRWKSLGEWAKRKWEMVDGLGVAMNVEDIGDWLAARPKGFLTDVISDEMQGSAFDSRQARGPLRLVENTRESAWWSKHESRRMVMLLGVVLTFVLGAAFVSLTISIGALKAAKVEQSGWLVQNVGGVVCSVLAFIVSVNLIRLLIDFYVFASEAEGIFRRCNRAVESPTLTERDAILITHDYQTARNSAPLLPTFIWKFCGNHLREQWAQVRRKTKTRPSSP
jgi:hypothetical protein